MPIVYEAPTGAGVPVTGVDGVVTAVVHGSAAGVLLRAQPLSTTEWVTFTRHDPSGSYTVRSGDTVRVIGGEAVAYDHEAPVGVDVSYTVTTAEGDVSAPVTVGITVGSGTAWLKSVNDPGLSVKVRVMEFTESYSQRSSFAYVSGSRFPTGLGEAEAALSGTLTVRTNDKAGYDGVQALASAGGVLVLVSSDAHGIPSPLFFRFGPGERHVVRAARTPGWTHRDHELPLTEVARPATRVAGLGWPLRVPGWSWDDAVAGLSDMADVQAAYPSMWDLHLAGVQ